MSYDLEIWSVRPLAAQPPLSGSGWQIVINTSDKVLPEDVEDEVSALVPGIGWMTELNLEGKATSQAAKLLRSTAKEIAKRAHGVIVDPPPKEAPTWRINPDDWKCGGCQSAATRAHEPGSPYADSFGMRMP